ncbi:MAG TPA: HD domain-containing protein [candidate division Zixibacteria bacterium]|nr:HD domain-containing protein [candidate division Zixibacteria bacterium]HPM36878.1 HD domain-containing protein [candidate division Zixibacteria bacterium]
MAALTPRGRSLAELQEELDRHIPATVFLLALPDENEDDEDEAERRRQLRLQARTTFFRAVSAVSELLARTAVERDVNLAKTRRVVHALIDHLSKDKDSLVELSAIKDFDDYTYAHSVNVSVYSLTLGIRLGLDRPRLSQLGFAALFHDAGKVRLDRDLINKPDSFDENDWIQMQMHPALGAKTILRSMKLDQHTARAARGAFEHHINADYTGYPLLHDIRPLNLYSQIITIADTFDALTSDRVYFRKAMAPDQVIRKMRFQMTAKFNPILIALFNEVMGIYPAGSMALLSTDEIAVIMAANAELYDRPYVQIVGNREGLLPEPEWVDLARADQINRRIVRLIDPERYGLKVRDFILSGPE